MKKIIINSGSFILFVFVLLSGCTGKFEEINTSPNSPEPSRVDPKFVLSTVISSSKLVTTEYQNCQLLVADVYAQFYANDVGTNYNSYNQSLDGITTMWNTVYSHLNSLNTVIRGFESDPLYTNVVQIARIWRSWMILRATDIWGDIPYFRACDGSGEAAPYDSQKDIYDDLFKTLADAVTKFDATKNNPQNIDLLYGGDYASWIRFANSLRLRMAIRISLVDPARAKTEAESAIAGGLISNAAQKAGIKCDATSNSARHPYNYIYAQGGFGMSLTLQNIVTGLGGQAWPATVNATEHPDMVDPRAPVMFNPSPVTGRWVGTRPGLIQVPATDVTNNIARIGSFCYSDPTRRFNILRYSEVCFLLAEAKVRFPSWNTGPGTAESWYLAGIRDNMTEWGIAAAVVNAYLENATPNVNGTTVPFMNTGGASNSQLDKILTQKWLALFPEGGWEAWADHRRTQIPKFIPQQNVNSQWFPGAYDSTQDVPQNYIRRCAYPNSEKTLNQANLDAALAPLGGQYEGYMRKPMWWDPYAENGNLK